MNAAATVEQFTNACAAVRERAAEWEPTFTLERQVREARRAMGEDKWRKLNEEWK